MNRLLTWCFGATAGLVAGALLTHAVRTDAELRAARRTARRLGAAGASSGGSETPGDGNGAQTGAQREGTLDVGDLHDRPDYQEAMRQAEAYPWEPTVDLTEWLDEHHPCTQRSPGGGLTCCQEGPHRAHLFLGTGGPDRKADNDEGIE